MITTSVQVFTAVRFVQAFGVGGENKRKSANSSIAERFFLTFGVGEE